MTENIPRVIPKGLGVEVKRSAWAIPPMFKWLQASARIGCGIPVLCCACLFK